MKKTHVVARACASPSLFQLFIISLDRLFLNSCCIDFHFLLLFFFSIPHPNHSLHALLSVKFPFFFVYCGITRQRKRRKICFLLRLDHNFLFFFVLRNSLVGHQILPKINGIELRKCRCNYSRVGRTYRPRSSKDDGISISHLDNQTEAKRERHPRHCGYTVSLEPANFMKFEFNSSWY